MDTEEKIKNAGLKVTPQRRIIYESMLRLRHASIEEILAHTAASGNRMTVSTVYRILDSFCKHGLLSQISHPGTGKICYDITVEEHGHMFSGNGIIDYDDPGLSGMIRKYIEEKDGLSGEIDRIQVQIIMKERNMN